MTTTGHGRARYQRGCRCAECKRANRDYQRRRRTKHLRPVPATQDVTTGDQSPAQAAADGPVVAAVRAQLAGLPAADDRPGVAAVAIALAQVIDTPTAVPQHAAAAHRLVEVLTSLSRSVTPRGRLSVVRGLTRPPPPLPE